MSDETPVTPAPPTKLRVGGLNPKAQKLQALRDKAAGVIAPKQHGLSSQSAKGTSSGFKKTNFQRKAT